MVPLVGSLADHSVLIGDDHSTYSIPISHCGNKLSSICSMWIFLLVPQGHFAVQKNPGNACFYSMGSIHMHRFVSVPLFSFLIKSQRSHWGLNPY
ncbi:hypothetical protein XENTR_v10006899 [Xenopus tropicalis]|nr:hypothetical protein XENTR_v10006899 [Xenopus tropicalis]